MGGSQRPLNPDILRSQGHPWRPWRTERHLHHGPGLCRALEVLEVEGEREASGDPAQAGELGQDITISQLLILQFPHESG